MSTGAAFIDIRATQNPDAFDLLCDGRAFGTIRRDWPGCRGWHMMIPTGGGDVIAIDPATLRSLAEYITDLESREAR